MIFYYNRKTTSWPVIITIYVLLISILIHRSSSASARNRRSLKEENNKHNDEKKSKTTTQNATMPVETTSTSSSSSSITSSTKSEVQNSLKQLFQQEEEKKRHNRYNGLIVENYRNDDEISILLSSKDKIIVQDDNDDDTKMNDNNTTTTNKKFISKLKFWKRNNKRKKESTIPQIGFNEKYCSKSIAKSIKLRRKNNKKRNNNNKNTLQNIFKRQYEFEQQEKENDIKMAYRMALLSEISYWDDRRPLPDNTIGFKLLSDPDVPTSSSSSTSYYHNYIDFTNHLDGPIQKIKYHSRIQFCLIHNKFNSIKKKLSYKKLFIWKWILKRTKNNNNNNQKYLPVDTIGNSTTKSNNNNNKEVIHLESSTLHKCQQQIIMEQYTGIEYTFNYWLKHWSEPGFPKVLWHDTDLLVSTSTNNVLVLSFAGTKSIFDHVTNVQTFVPAEQSIIFNNINSGGGGGGNRKNHTLKGSLHRGFLNAYSRVERGTAIRLCGGGDSNKCTTSTSSNEYDANHELTKSLYRRYGHCFGNYTSSSSDDKKKKKKKKGIINRWRGKHKRDNSVDDLKKSTSIDMYTNKNALDGNNNNTDDTHNTTILDHNMDNNNNNNIDETNNNNNNNMLIGCNTHGEKLMDILRELVTDALRNNKIVHLTGHSQGGAIATLLALDIIINFPNVSIKNLNLWTFGAPEVADDIFLQSAIDISPRLKSFLKGTSSRKNKKYFKRRRKKFNRYNKQQYHRYVTLSDKCEVDFVSTIASKALPTHNNNNKKQNWKQKLIRRFGGVHGKVIHFSNEPYYLITTTQYNSSQPNIIEGIETPKVRTKSSLSAHHITNYLQGISRESNDHPLVSNLPLEMRQWIAS